MIIITTQPQDGTYQVGEFLSVTATGYNLTYQWQKFNTTWQNITGATSSSMRIIWSGTYRVVITEPDGTLVTNLNVPLVTDDGEDIVAFDSAGDELASDSAVVTATSVFDDLIYDRTLNDVETATLLHNKVANGTATAQEITRWNSSLKGKYNISDLNRIERALIFVKTYSSWFGVTITYATTPSERWVAGTFPNSTELNKTLANVGAVKTAWAFTDTLPDSYVGLDYTKANQIEKLLHKVRETTE